jgi:hypothetical protein
MSWIYNKIKNEFVNPNSDLRHKIPKNIAQAAANFTGKFVNKKLPPNSKKWLDNYASDVITKVTIKRAPVHRAIGSFLNLASGGRFNEGKKDLGYDDLFHLSLVIEHKNPTTGKVTESQLEKLERVSFSNKITEAPNTETINVEIPGNQIIGDVVLRWMEKMGDDFYIYDAFANNCQTFIGGFLKATEALNAPGVKAFIYQNAKQLLEKQPGYLGNLAKSITNLGAIVNQVIQGGSMQGGAYLEKDAFGEWFVYDRNGNIVARYPKKELNAAAGHVARLIREEERTSHVSPPRPPRVIMQPPPPAPRGRRVNPIHLPIPGLDTETDEAEEFRDSSSSSDKGSRRSSSSSSEEGEIKEPQAKRKRGGLRPPMLKLLELFKGTGSVGKVAERMGMDVMSIDILDKYKPDITADILDWDYKAFHKETDFIPDLLWASPPCNTFSTLAYVFKERNTKNAKPKSARAKQGTAILYRTLEIIEYFQKINPKLVYVIENPRGMMRLDEKVMKLPHRDTTLYCLYDDVRRKPTDFFNNMENFMDKMPDMTDNYEKTTHHRRGLNRVRGY